MKKPIIVFYAVLLAFSICLFCGCSTDKTETEIQTENDITIQTTEATTLPVLKVSLGVTKATAIDEKVMKQSGIIKWVDECRGIYVSNMSADSICPIHLNKHSRPPRRYYSGNRRSGNKYA